MTKILKKNLVSWFNFLFSLFPLQNQENKKIGGHGLMSTKLLKSILFDRQSDTKCEILSQLGFEPWFATYERLARFAKLNPCWYRILSLRINRKKFQNSKYFYEIFRKY